MGHAPPGLGWVFCNTQKPKAATARAARARWCTWHDNGSALLAILFIYPASSIKLPPPLAKMISQLPDEAFITYLEPPRMHASGRMARVRFGNSNLFGLGSPPCIPPPHFFLSLSFFVFVFQLGLCGLALCHKPSPKGQRGPALRGPNSPKTDRLEIIQHMCLFKT